MAASSITKSKLPPTTPFETLAQNLEKYSFIDTTEIIESLLGVRQLDGTTTEPSFASFVSRGRRGGKTFSAHLLSYFLSICHSSEDKAKRHAFFST